MLCWVLSKPDVTLAMAELSAEVGFEAVATAEMALPSADFVVC